MTERSESRAGMPGEGHGTTERQRAAARACLAGGHRHDRRCEWVLLSAIAVLAVSWSVGLLLGVRAPCVGSVAAPPVAPSRDDPAFLAEKDRQEQSLAALRTAAEEATTAVDDGKTAAAAARAEAAAAKAEATAARAEARRVLEAAHAEADTVLEHAHRQAEQDAEQVRAAARRSGEREVALLDHHRQGARRRGRAPRRADRRAGAAARRRGRAARRAGAPARRHGRRPGRPRGRADRPRVRRSPRPRSSAAGSWSGSPA